MSFGRFLREQFGVTVGGAAIVAVATANVVLWLLARPVHEPTWRYVGELLGAEAVLLFSCALVLATLLGVIERAFGGLDRVSVWHRNSAVAGVLLLLPHDLFASSRHDPYATGIGPALGDVALFGLLVLTVWALAPKLRAARWPGPIRRLARASYERWLTAHRLTGLFVIAAVAHGALVAPTLHHSTLLRVAFLVIGGVGIVAYAYRELLARFVIPIHDYTVSDVHRPNPTTLDVSLDPVREPLGFVPGQFVVLAFGGEDGWQRHPFSIASEPSERGLEVAIKESGDYTRDLHDSLRPGTPARVVGPFGGFDYRTGGERQLWIAGGIGVTPFMSWIRSLDASFDRDVDFYYSVSHESDAVFAEEVTAAGERYPTLRAHIVVTEEHGLLTAKAMLGSKGSNPGVWVYMCGPPPMTAALSKDFRRLGVPSGHIRWEQFDVR